MTIGEVKVFAPASVANVAVGFDILGFALYQPGDEIIARRTEEPGVRIRQITGTGKKKLPLEAELNTAGYAALQLLKAQGIEDWGVELEVHKKMPFGSGLGSSAASAAGAVVAVNALLPQPLDRLSLLPYAVLGEQIADGAYHADNVAPSLLGGMILVRSNETLDVHRLPVPPNFYAAVVYPEVEILTKDARQVLQPTVSLAATIAQTGNLAGFITGLFTNDLELIGRSLTDHVVEPQRARLIPHFYEVKGAALEQGALGCSISGAGPSIFALTAELQQAQRAGHAMQAVFARNGIESHLFVSPINQDGVVVLEQKASHAVVQYQE